MRDQNVEVMASKSTATSAMIRILIAIWIAAVMFITLFVWTALIIYSVWVAANNPTLDNLVLYVLVFIVGVSATYLTIVGYNHIKKGLPGL